MKPLIYGYMRVDDGRPDEEIRQDEQEMIRWAQAEGYDMVAIYWETDKGSTAELTALIEQLKRTKTSAVLVPSIEHFGAGPLLQELRWARIAQTVGAEVHEVNG